MLCTWSIGMWSLNHWPPRKSLWEHSYLASVIVMPPFWHPLWDIPRAYSPQWFLWLHHFVPTIPGPPRPARSLMRNHWGPGNYQAGLRLFSLPCPPLPKKFLLPPQGCLAKTLPICHALSTHDRDPDMGTFIAAGGTKVLCHCAWPHSYHLPRFPSVTCRTFQRKCGKVALLSSLWSTGRTEEGGWWMSQSAVSTAHRQSIF